jgi:hypothetical protein
LKPHLGGIEPDRWLTTAEPAAHLGCSPNALHKLTAAGAVPFQQDCPGGKLYVKHSELEIGASAGGRAEAARRVQALPKCFHRSELKAAMIEKLTGRGEFRTCDLSRVKRGNAGSHRIEPHVFGDSEEPVLPIRSD